MEYKLHRNCLYLKWTTILAHVGETVVQSAKMWDQALKPAKELCWQSWWVLWLGVMLFNLLKKKKNIGRKKMKTYILSAINGNNWSRIILDYYFFFYLALRCSVSLRNLSFIKAEWSHFPHRHMAHRKVLTMSLLSLPLKTGRGGKSQARNAYFSVFLTVWVCDGAHAKEQVVPL